MTHASSGHPDMSSHNHCATCKLYFPLNAQVRKLRGGERGRAGAAHLLKMPQGALLRAALSGGGLERPPSSVRAVAGAPGLSAPLERCAAWGEMWVGPVGVSFQFAKRRCCPCGRVSICTRTYGSKHAAKAC